MQGEGREIKTDDRMLDAVLWANGIVELSIFDNDGWGTSNVKLNKEQVDRLVEFLVNGIAVIE